MRCMVGMRGISEFRSYWWQSHHDNADWQQDHLHCRHLPGVVLVKQRDWLPAQRFLHVALEHRGYNTEFTFTATVFYTVQKYVTHLASNTETVKVQCTDLVMSLIVPAEPVHDGDRQPARGDLLVALHVELVVDVLDGVVLVLPWLNAGAEVTASHHHRLQEQSSAGLG